MRRYLRQRVVALGLALLISTGPGCRSTNNTEEGMVNGGIIGLIGGTIIGSLVGHPKTGAAVGTATGAFLGGASGAAEDRRERRAVQQEMARQNAMSQQDIVNLTASGSSDDVIVNQIRTTGAVFHLTSADIVNLQNAGVREPVIREMQASGCRPPRLVYSEVPVGPPVVFVPAPPPPPVGFGVGVRIR